MNVALTRARASLFVLGHCPTLERSDGTWKDIISDARVRTCLIEVSNRTTCTTSTVTPLGGCGLLRGSKDGGCGPLHSSKGKDKGRS